MAVEDLRVERDGLLDLGHPVERREVVLRRDVVQRLPEPEPELGVVAGGLSERLAQLHHVVGAAVAPDAAQVGVLRVGEHAAEVDLAADRGPRRQVLEPLAVLLDPRLRGRGALVASDGDFGCGAIFDSLVLTGSAKGDASQPAKNEIAAETSAAIIQGHILWRTHAARVRSWARPTIDLIPDSLSQMCNQSGFVGAYRTIRPYLCKGPALPILK